MKNKKIKTISMILLLFGVLMVVTGVSMAFFNYTRIGLSNTLAVGRVYFISSQGNAINLTNVFPVKSTEIENNPNVGSVTINVQGDTTYNEGIEYLISAVDVNNTINNKAVPIGISVTASNLGTSDSSYYTNRGGNTSIYKVIAEDPIYEDSHIAVGYITKGATGINGSITVKAYIDADRIAITDTYDGTESDNMNTQTEWVEERVILTSTEWNSLISGGVSFKVKVEANEGIWVEEHLSFDRLIASKVSQSYVASYDDIITSNPTFTTQDQVSTSATKQTVYYYTGDDAAANANVLFAGYCWQIVRTTDNGGIRMIYNGIAVNNKCETTRIATKGVTEADHSGTQTMTSATLFGRSFDYNLTAGEFTIQDSTGLPTLWSTSDNNSNGVEDYKELIGTYTCLSSSNTCNTLYYVGSINPSNTAQAYVAKYTIDDVAHYSEMGKSAFNANSYSVALAGYMFNEEYDYNVGAILREHYTIASWENGVYVLSSGNGGTAPDVSHHYVCETGCTKVRYIYYLGSRDNHQYILLENGVMAEDAIYRMTGNGSNETKTKAINANYKLNNYDSAIKGYLDNWYKKNLTAYTSYLDGASVYCNDRSISDLGGWNPNGTSITASFQFYQYNINRNLNCVNETDRFALTNSKAQLTYPIGLLTEPERNLMTNDFAKTGQTYYVASPYNYTIGASINDVVGTGANHTVVVQFNLGVRGVITLKPGTVVLSGTGTYLDPYVVGPIVTRTN